MKPETLIVIGGLYNAAFAIFHLGFWKIFGWKRDLVSLTPANRAIMQVLNLCLIFSFLIFAYISIFHTAELVATGIGRALLALIALFWLLRAVEQPVFFGLSQPLSVAFLVIFLAGFGLYGYAWMASAG